MPVEVKQLVIHGEVAPTDPGDLAGEPAVELDIQALREALLEECRRLIAEELRQARER